MNLSNGLIDFCSYIQPILNGCLGFVKTNGYFTHIPGKILAMSGDETVFVSIDLPMIYDVYITSIIGKFIQLKEDEQKLNAFEESYFTGWNIKRDSLLRYNELYSSTKVDDSNCIFYEPDCYNIPNFTEAMSATSIDKILVSDGMSMYLIPASKSITSASKSDSVSLKIYNYMMDPNANVKTVRYILFKKKFKLNVDIFLNIIKV